MTEYQSYYYVVRKGRNWEIYSTCHEVWIYMTCYETYDEALQALIEKGYAK